MSFWIKKKREYDNDAEARRRYLTSLMTHINCFVKQLKTVYSDPNITNFKWFENGEKCNRKANDNYCGACARGDFYHLPRDSHVRNYFWWLSELADMLNVNDIMSGAISFKATLDYANELAYRKKLPVRVTTRFYDIISIVYKDSINERFLFTNSDKNYLTEKHFPTNNPLCLIIAEKDDELGFEKIQIAYEFLESVEIDTLLRTDVEDITYTMVKIMRGAFLSRFREFILSGGEEEFLNIGSDVGDFMNWDDSEDEDSDEECVSEGHPRESDEEDYEDDEEEDSDEYTNCDDGTDSDISADSDEERGEKRSHDYYSDDDEEDC